MKNDKFILLIAILNIIVLTFVFAFIADKNRNKEPEKPEPTPEPIIEIVRGSKSCDLSIQTGNDRVINTNHLEINYTNDIITSYKISYNLVYDGNRKARPVFENYRNDYDNFANIYKNVENYTVSDYFNEGSEFRVTIEHNINENDENFLMFGKNQNINDVIASIEEQGYICE